MSQLDQQKKKEIKELLEEGLSIREICRQTGVSRQAIRRVSTSTNVNDKVDELTFSHLPSSTRSVEELLSFLKDETKRRKNAVDARALIDIKVNVEGPVMFAMFGDPHLDDPHCDYDQLIADIECCQHIGVFGLCAGDYTNNWVGRLAKLYSDHVVSRKEANTLIEWFFKSVPWLALIGGNHDEWNSEAGNVTDLILKRAGVNAPYLPFSGRLRVASPNGSSLTIHGRHNFTGRSQYNKVHGMVKETLWNYRDDLLFCGDWHHSGYGVEWHNQPKMLCHLVRLGTYKYYDKYAVENGFKDENWAPAMAAIFDPDSKDPRTKVRVFFDLKSGVEYLNWLRKQRKLPYGKRGKR